MGYRVVAMSEQILHEDCPFLLLSCPLLILEGAMSDPSTKVEVVDV